MKFENYDVQTMYYELIKKYGGGHLNLGRQFDHSPMNYEDLIVIEEDLKSIDKLFKDMEN